MQTRAELANVVVVVCPGRQPVGLLAERNRSNTREGDPLQGHVNNMQSLYRQRGSKNTQKSQGDGARVKEKERKRRQAKERKRGGGGEEQRREAGPAKGGERATKK